MTTDTVTPRVWIGCLAAYNAGRLHGEWVDATQDADDLYAAAKKVIDTSPAWQLDGHAEEWFLADNEGFDGLIGEYTDLGTVARVAAAIEEHGPAMIAWLGNESDLSEERIESFTDAYCGEWDSLKAYAESYAEETGQFTASMYLDSYADARVKEALQEVFDRYIDWDAYAETFTDDFWTSQSPDYKVFVFRSNY